MYPLLESDEFLEENFRAASRVKGVSQGPRGEKIIQSYILFCFQIYTLYSIYRYSYTVFPRNSCPFLYNKYLCTIYIDVALDMQYKNCQPFWNTVCTRILIILIGLHTTACEALLPPFRDHVGSCLIIPDLYPHTIIYIHTKMLIH